MRTPSSTTRADREQVGTAGRRHLLPMTSGPRPDPSAVCSTTKADAFRRFEVITGVGRRRRWSDEDKARIVAESLDPATTASAVARRYGLHASQLFTWRQQLQGSAATAALGERAF